MRKILLGTTGVVGAALIGMGAAQAQTAPTVRIGGYLQTTFAWADDDLDYARGAPTGVNAAGTQRRSTNDFRNEVEIHVFVNGKAANGLAYGAVVEIQNDNVGGGSGSALDLDEAYMFVTSPTLGTIRFGEEDSAASIMQVRAPTITGFGADGAWDVGILGTANGSGGNPSILTGINDGSDSTKVVYLSPQFFGFDFGLSYAANAGEGDRAFFGRQVDTLGAGGTTIAQSATQRDKSGLNNEWSGALRYRGSFQNVGIAAGFGAMRANAQRNALVGTTGAVPAFSPAGSGFRFSDITAYTVGLNLTAFGFTLGGEYTWGSYSGSSVGRAPLANNPDGSERDDSSHWLLGLTYVTGAWSFGGYYGQGSQDNGCALNAARVCVDQGTREQTGWGIGVAYTLAPGLELFANYNQAQDDNVNIVLNGGTLQNREWQGFFLGTRLAF
jgi:hypothetical protein